MKTPCKNRFSSFSCLPTTGFEPVWTSAEIENSNKKYVQTQIRTRTLWTWVCKNFHRRNFCSKDFNKNLWTGSISWWIYQDNDILLITQPFSALFRMKTVFICSGASQMSNVTYHFVSHVLNIILYRAVFSRV